MKNKKEIFWCLKSENYGLIAFVALTRRGLVSKSERGLGLAWKELKKRGYKAVKVNIQEID